VKLHLLILLLFVSAVSLSAPALAGSHSDGEALNKRSEGPVSLRGLHPPPVRSRSPLSPTRMPRSW
jgi:hypothetical protein